MSLISEFKTDIYNKSKIGEFIKQMVSEIEPQCLDVEIFDVYEDMRNRCNAFNAEICHIQDRKGIEYNHMCLALDCHYSGTQEFYLRQGLQALMMSRNVRNRSVKALVGLDYPDCLHEEMCESAYMDHKGRVAYISYEGKEMQRGLGIAIQFTFYDKTQ